MSLKLLTKRIFRKRGETPSLLDYAYKNKKIRYFNDVTIKSGAMRIPANRMVLSCYCRFFEKLFKSKTEQAKKNVVEIKQVDGMTMNRLIEYIYIGCIYIDNDNVLDILAGAHHLELDEVKRFCFEFLLRAVTTVNCFVIYKQAVKYENFDLKQRLYVFMSENFKEIFKTEDFKTLSYFDLFPCLYNLNRELVNESVLCKCIIDWTMNNKGIRKEWFQNRLIRLVDVNQIHYNVLQKIVSEKLLDEDEDRLSLIKERMNEIWYNQMIISIGGSDTETKVLEIWNPHDWTKLVIPDLPSPKNCHCSLVLENIVYAIGGCTGDSDNNITSELLSLDVDEDSLKWKKLKSMNEKRWCFGATVFNDVLVVCGGSDGKNSLASCEAYFPSLNRWKMLASMKQKRFANGLVALDGYLYAIGGLFGDSLSSVERKHGLVTSWNSVASLKTPRHDFAAETFNGNIYVMGGCTVNKQHLKSVEMFNPSSDCWTFCESMNRVRNCLAACVFQDKIFVVGGLDEKVFCLNEFECYDPSENCWETVGSSHYNLFYHSIVTVREK